MLSSSHLKAEQPQLATDWIELYVATEQKELSKSDLRNFIEDNTAKEAKDTEIDDIWYEAREREKLYGDVPPFTVEGDVISSTLQTWDNRPDYIACLIFSLTGNKGTRAASTTAAGKYFERISNEAIRNYINGESRIFGFPNSSQFSLESVVESECYEKYIAPLPSNFKDMKLDIIAWKPWGDGRPSQMIMYVQCAAGDNWEDKLTELNLKSWANYVNLTVDPIRGFTLPKIVPENIFRAKSNEGGVLIDRARIFRYTMDLDFQDSTLKSELITWCRARINDLSDS